MQINVIPEKLRRLEIPGRIEILAGLGGLPMAKVSTPWSSAEVYLHGAHVTGFQKNGEAPLIFVSRQSDFASDRAIRGGVPICFPWFGSREGEPSHGFARITTWELVNTNADDAGTVTLHFALPEIPGREAWKSLRTEFVVTIGETLTLELMVTNESCGETFEIENCLHTYFHVGEIGAVSIHGLETVPYLDFALGANGTPKPAENDAIHIVRETNRTYLDTAAPVEIRDEKLKRIIRVEKLHSQSTVVWNPWTTQKLPGDFDPAEHAQMVCVESGNVKQNRLSLAPGKATALKVVLSSATL